MSNVEIRIHCPNCNHIEPYTKPPPACPECGDTYLDAIFKFEQPLTWPEGFEDRPNSMWRYRELLPIMDDANIVSMGEGMTPLIHSKNLGSMLGLKNLYIKDERQGPTGSFKDRQASLAISTMKELGIKEAVVASTGNVAIAYSAYAARAGIKLWVFTISSVPPEKMREVTLYGSELVKVTGTYDQAKQVAHRFAESKGLHIDLGVKNISAKEAMKTLAFEIAHQLGEIYGPTESGKPWRSPDWYIQAVSGGMGPVGLMKGFKELNEFGFVEGVPKLGSIQSSGCDPMVRAFLEDAEDAAPILQPQTLIATVATDVPGIAYKILRKYAKQYGGQFVSVSDEEAYRALVTVAQLDGMSVEPATALAFAGLFKMVQEKMIKPDEVVVLNCSGHTFPVEKHALGDDVTRDMDVTPFTEAEIPEEGLLSAFESIGENINKVLIIEDDPGASVLMERILNSYGIPEIFQAPDGAAGIKMVKEVEPDLIVLDLMMPNIDGYGVLDELKKDKKFRDVPVIVVTAKDLTLSEKNRLSNQVHSLLQKGSFMSDEVLQELINEKLG